MKQEVIQKGMQMVDKLAAKLDVASERLMGMLMKQAYVRASTNIFQYILSICFMIFSYKFIIKTFDYIKNEKEKDRFYSVAIDDKGFWLLLSSIILGVVSVFLCLGIFFTLIDTITALFNPEYWALKEIIEQMSNLSQ